MAVSPVLLGLQLPIDLTRDLVPLARFVQANWAIAVPKDAPFRTLPELIAAARARPRALNYGHAGVGSLQHLATEWLRREAGIGLLPITYRGTGPAVLDLIAGRLHLLLTSLGDFSAQIQAGDLRLLAMADDIGSPLFPNAPQVSVTLPGFAVSSWLGACGPRGIAPEVVAWWERVTQAALTAPGLPQRLTQFGLTPGYQDAAEFGRTMEAGRARWRAVAESAGIRAE